MNLNTLLIVLGFIISTAAQSVIGYAYIDSRFDKVEHFQIELKTENRAAWNAHEERAAWTEFENLNPDLSIELPNIQKIKNQYRYEK